MSAWVVRAGIDCGIIEHVRRRSVIAIGWPALGDCSGLHTREAFRAVYQRVYPHISMQSGQVYRFVREIMVGDTVLTPDSPAREVLIGVVAGEYSYEPDRMDKPYPQVRRVRWLNTVSRDDMSPRLRRKLHCQLTVFTVPEFDEEIERLVAG